ncbi:MAG: Ig-like domain-containing protein [Gemmatimonadota bacterium]
MSRKSSHLAGLFALFLLAGCGGDSPTGPGGGGGGGNAIALVSGSGQSTGTGGALSSPLTARVTSGGAPVSGVSVTWAVATSAGPGATLSATSTTTDASGNASVTFTVGSTPGTYTVTASITGGSVTFSATAVARVAATVSAVSGSGQAGTVSTTLPAPFVAEVRDQFGDPLSGQAVAFAISRGASGTPGVTPASATTDSGGQASATLTLGSKNGTYGVRATADTASVEFLATASGGVADLIGVTAVTPDTMTEGGTATIMGTGFSPTASANSVWIDGRAATVTAASDTMLTVTVPDFSDVCLPRRAAAVQVALGPDSAGVFGSQVKPGLPVLSLAPGADTVVAGAGVGCVQLPGHAAGAEYEVTASLAPVGFAATAARVSVNGRGPLVSLRMPGAPAPAARSVRPARRAARGPMLDSMLVRYRWEERLREMEQPLLPAIRARAAGAFGLAGMPPTVGDTATFGVSCTSQPSVHAKAVSVGTAAAIFEDTTAGGAYFTTAQYDSIAAEFDTLVFRTDTAYFGAPADIDGNGRVIMLFTPEVNALTPGNYSAGFVAGFFCGTDLIGANNAEMFYLVVPDPTGTFNPNASDSLSASTVRTNSINTIAHEFQHLINAQVGGGGAAPIWINEGLSQLAEEVNGHAFLGFSPGSELAAADLTGANFPRFVQWYSANFLNLSFVLVGPADTAGLVQQNDPINVNDPNGSFRMRGAAWSFLRYALDRAGGSEAVLTKALVAGTGDARANISSVTGVPFEDLVADWHAMLSVEDRADLGGVPRTSLQLTSYKLLDLYANISLDAASNPGTLQFGYPLAPLARDLAATGSVTPLLYPGTAEMLTLSASGAGSGGTGLRFEAASGADLPMSALPRLVIVRTK